MKKLNILLSMLFVSLTLGLTSCDNDYYGPPGAAYDPNLIGTWELYYADGVRVYGYQTNWLEFYKNGRGTYYYYQDALDYQMGLTYSVDWYGGTQQLYITYADGRYVSMNYWYNSNYTYLYTQWYDRGYQHTYVYRYVDGPQWAPMKEKFMPVDTRGGEQISLPALTPGLTIEE